MVFLVMMAAGARYAVPASQVLEVVLAPALRALPGTPGFVAGVFSFHGKVVPVIDLSVLIAGAPSRPVLSTRILLVKVQPSPASRPLLLGFLAEHVTDTIACGPEEFQSAGVHGSGAPYAGGILVRPDGLIQQLDLERVLTPELREQLFACPAEQV